MLLLTTKENNTALLSFKTGQRSTVVSFPISPERRIDQVREAVGKVMLVTVKKYVHHRKHILTKEIKYKDRYRLMQLVYVQEAMHHLAAKRTRGIAVGILNIYEKLQAIAPGITSKFYPEDTILLQELKRLCQDVVRDDQFEIPATGWSPAG